MTKTRRLAAWLVVACAAVTAVHFQQVDSLPHGIVQFRPLLGVGAITPKGTLIFLALLGLLSWLTRRGKRLPRPSSPETDSTTMRTEIAARMCRSTPNPQRPEEDPMSGPQRALIVLVVSLIAACIAAYGVYGAISHLQVREGEIADRFVVVAAKAMRSGTVVTKDSVKLVPWPAKSPLTGGFDRVETVVDRGLIAGVVENEPITESKLMPQVMGFPTIRPGLRAMTVPVSKSLGGGLIVPGARVDVLVTNESVTRVAVSNVQVLTAGVRYGPAQDNKGRPIPTAMVTLLVTSEDSERIALAQSEGQLMLSLRNPTEPAKTSANAVGAPMRAYLEEAIRAVKRAQ